MPLLRVPSATQKASCALLLITLVFIFLGQLPRGLPSGVAITHSAVADYTFGQGYIEAGANGGAYAFGNGTYEGSTFSANGTSAQGWWGNPINGVAALPGNNGYYFSSNDTSADDSITCAFGAAQAYEFFPYPGYHPNTCTLTQQNVDNIVGIAVDNANGGYWEVGADGAVYSYNGAPYYGNALGNINPSYPVVGIAATPDGGGYWLVTSNGNVYAPRYNGAGDSQYEGGISGSLNCVNGIVGIVAAQNDSSYWMDACDGGVFAFGQAQYYGSLAGTPKYFNIEAIASTPDGYGNYLMAFDGSIFTYGDAQFQGDLYGNTTYGQIAGVAGTS
jgi:hypothetical protein